MKYTKRISLHFIPIALIGLYVFGFQYLPLQDYPDWLYQGVVFNKYFFHDNSFDGFFILNHYLPPNAISTIGIGVLTILLPAMLAGKLFVCTTLLFLYFGINNFIYFFGPRKKIFSMAFAFFLAFNLHFFFGNISFLFGVGLVLCAFTALVQNKKIYTIRYLMPLFFFAYLSHFFAFFILLILVFSYQRSEKKKILTLLFFASIPTLLIMCHYYFSKSLIDISSSEPSTPLYYLMRAKLVSLTTVQIPFEIFRFISEPTMIMNYLNYFVEAATIFFIFYSLVRRFVNKERTMLTTIVLICTILAVFFPLKISGLYDPTSRIVLLLLISLISQFGKLYEQKKYFKIATAFIILFCIGAYSWNFFIVLKFNSMLSSDKTILLNQDIHDPKHEGINSFLRFQYYDAIEKEKPMPIFTTGLFIFRGADPRNPDNQNEK